MIKNSLEEKNSVFTDKSTSYVDILCFINLHITKKSNKETKNERILPLVMQKETFLENISNYASMNLYIDSIVDILKRNY